MSNFFHTIIKPPLKAIGLHKVTRALKRKFWAMEIGNKDTESVFTDIYKKNKWGDEESISGPGSTLDETEHLRTELDALFKKLNLKTMVDLPCGDFNWFKEIDYKFEKYIGCDIVQALIDENNEKYSDNHHFFQKLDCLTEEIPQCDLFFCRDLLIHFSNDDIFRFFDNILRSDIKWVMISHAVNHPNENIKTGQGRLVNLTAAPFNLPQPATIIMENAKVNNGRWKDIRSMALWRKDDIAQTLQKSKAA
ncbi:class I SAM-dependent methyltransferase [Alphaproteobacteria bacterium]|nr:class I SAM-dependent methyltransferase [Alphaproteobacteria bacterium]